MVSFGRELRRVAAGNYRARAWPLYEEQVGPRDSTAYNKILRTGCQNRSRTPHKETSVLGDMSQDTAEWADEHPKQINAFSDLQYHLKAGAPTDFDLGVTDTNRQR